MYAPDAYFRVAPTFVFSVPSSAHSCDGFTLSTNLWFS